MDHESHLSDVSKTDIFEVDELQRRGPKYGISLSEPAAATIVSRLVISAEDHLETLRVSSLGYNNRLYFATSAAGLEIVIKVCGRYWKRVKTETEVVGLFLAGLHTKVPVPSILAWDAEGKEFGVEYTAMKRLDGVQLSTIWDDLLFQPKLDVVGQLAEIVVAYRSRIGSVAAQMPARTIGNFRIRATGKDEEVLEGSDFLEFEVGSTLEGLGPWTSYRAYICEQIRTKLASVQAKPGMEKMRLMLPRVEKVLESVRTDERFDDPLNEFVFTHADLTMENLMVATVGDVPTIRAVLDWEWSGMFPAEEEFFTSFDFILDCGNDCETTEPDDPQRAKQLLRNHFFDILETGGVGSPRTLPNFQLRKNLYDLRENLLPWFVEDCDDIAEAVEQAVQRVAELLTRLEEDSL